MQIAGVADSWRLRRSGGPGLAGLGWTESCQLAWRAALASSNSFMSLDMTNISFVALLEWVYVAALIENLVATRDDIQQFDIDLLGRSDRRLVPAEQFLRRKDRSRNISQYTKDEYLFSEDRYRIAGFLEAIGTMDVLNRPHRRTKVIYPGIGKEAASLLNFYAGPDPQFEKPTVVLGLQRIEAKDDCKQFIDESQIQNWRSFMEERFRRSPLFESEELWRVLCHELAVNIWEHAGVAGFLAARVVESPIDSRGMLRRWCRATYPDEICHLLPKMRNGFLELCVADAGQGFVTTLEPSFKSANQSAGQHVDPREILAFSFDELGTCKGKEGGWATGKHALWRILRIAAKYGGALRLRSGRAEVIYLGEGGWFERSRNNLGYKPSASKLLGHELLGSQLQLVLPLNPQFDHSTSFKRSSALDYGLPNTFRVQREHVRGHLVPLLETLEQPEACIGEADQLRFKESCERLARNLLTERPRTDPMVLDFSGLNWTPAQFETLLYLLQNVIQSRPTLLVEIERELALGAAALQRDAAPTTLLNEIINSEASVTGRAFAELSESRYLETYTGIHSTVLGVDRNGDRYIFGVPGPEYEEALLTLIEQPSRIETLCVSFEGVKESILRAILTPMNPTFRLRDDNWSLFWDESALANETSRAMSEHFDEVAARCEAWRGRTGSAEGELFHLPWIDAWRLEFLETSRILSRERHADEVAQRLLYRLRHGLELRGKQLKDVRVLACISAPAMLIASALHRWWPTGDRPAISDLGYYVMLSDQPDLPAVLSTGGVVLVQDILDTGHTSEGLIQALKRQNVDVLCALSLVRLVDKLEKTTITSIRDGWLPEVAGQFAEVPRHAMIEVARPKECNHPPDDTDDSHAFWIEPRALRPVRYPTLRREFPPGRDSDLERRDAYLRRFDIPPGGCLFAAGHYVYGRRHYAVAVDVRRVLMEEIGEDVAAWLADVCEGGNHALRRWERRESANFRGDVSAVLMPLSSQIHYIWPKVSNKLAQRGRRQPAWFLEAALFTGHGPGFRMPLQLQHQIEMAIGEAETRSAGKARSVESGLRILIIDDAIATGRTAETIIGSLLWTIEKLFRRAGKSIETHQSPIQWIRYFAVLNQMEHSQHILWRNLKTVGTPSISFIFEDFAPFMGVPVYGKSDCPACQERARLLLLAEECGRSLETSARAWALERADKLKPIAIDSPGFLGPNPGDHCTNIDVLAPRPVRFGAHARYIPAHADTAIWRFYELMYLSYPPSDVLRSLRFAFAAEGASERVVEEFARYRWVVLDWCIRNWPRIVADTARARFKEASLKEIDENTSLVEPLLEACSVQSGDPYIRDLIRICVERLTELEIQRQDPDRGAEPDRIERATRLENALTLFYMEVHLAGAPTLDRELLVPLEDSRQKLASKGHTFVGNIYKRITRSQREADPKWALETVAESLFRGRDSQESPSGSHQLLPRLINNVVRHPDDREDRRLLHGSLALFIAALEDLLPYTDMDVSDGAAELRHLAEIVLGWLKHPAEAPEAADVPQEVRDLEEALDLKGEFCKSFGELFHDEVDSLLALLGKRIDEIGAKNLTFLFCPTEEAKRSRVLTHIQRLVVFIANLVIDPAKKRSGEYFSKVEVFLVDEGASLRFRLVTNFEQLEETGRLTSGGRSGRADRTILEAFGARFDSGWSAPSDAELSEGLLASYEFYMPTGFSDRRF